MGQPNLTIQNNFTGGEVTPRIRGQVSNKKYLNGLATLLNQTVLVQGGSPRRVGTLFVNRVRTYLTSTALIRLVPFIFSTTQNYVIEFGNLYAQYYRQRSLVTNSSVAISAATNASPTQITAAGHGLVTGDQVVFSGMRGMIFINQQNLNVTVIDANNFTVAVDTTSDGAYVASSGSVSKIYATVTPWASADLKNIKFTQSADTLYLGCTGYSPRTMSRTADNNWTITDIRSSFVDGPYLTQNTTVVTITPSGTTGSITLTASAAIFASTDIDRHVRIFIASTWAWARITAFTDTTHVTALVGSTAMGGTSASAVWRLGAWSDTTGWPQVVMIHQQRLLFACTSSQPQTIFGSNSGDFLNMSPSNSAGTINDANGFSFTISDDQVNAIRAMSSGPILSIFTASGEYSMFAGGNNQYVPITPSNVNIKRETTHGSVANVRVKRIGNSIMYTQNSRRRMREHQYSYQADGYIGTDMTKYSEHITLSGIVDFDYQEEIDSTGWLVRQDGTLIGFTYDKDEAVTAWHRHILGGTYTDPNAPGAIAGQAIVESVAVIPDPTGSYGDVWLCVKRTINGQTVRYIEVINDPFDPATNGQRSGYFVDSGLTYNGYLTASITPAAVSGTGITITASAAVFTSTMVGKQIRSGSARATITAFTDSTHVVVTIVSAFSSTSPIIAGNWYLGVQNFSGVFQLEGQSCQVCADGAPLPNITPVNGKFSLDDFYGMVHVGLGYVSQIKQLPTENQSIGTSQGIIKRIHDISVYLYNSLGLKFGPSFSKLEILPFRQSQDPMNAAPPLFTGIKRIPFNAGYEVEPVACLQQDQPLPMTVLFITQAQEIYS